MFQFFEDDDAGAFAHDETVAVFIERTRSVSRVIVARAEGFHRRKAGQLHPEKRQLPYRQQGLHRVRLLNHAVSVTDGVGTRCAGRNDAGAVALKAEEAGYLAGGHVDNHLRYDKGIDADGPSKRGLYISYAVFHAADAGADNGTDTVAIFFVC